MGIIIEVITALIAIDQKRLTSELMIAPSDTDVCIIRKMMNIGMETPPSFSGFFRIDDISCGIRAIGFRNTTNP